jgi:DNA gyrase/topoisomerase IV subunit B
VTEHGYSAADITVLSMADAVRKRPGMYFEVGPGDPRLATNVLCAVVRHAFHPPARVADSHTTRVVVEITADLAFSVTDDQAETLTSPDTPKLGYEKSLLTPTRWLCAAAAAVSSQTTVEIWREGQGFRQRLTGLSPSGPPAQFPAPVGSGTRVAYVLDPAFFGSAVITSDIGTLDVHGPHCADDVGPGEIVVRDHRSDNSSTEQRYV